jgi:hypothetical protein
MAVEFKRRNEEPVAGGQVVQRAEDSRLALIEPAVRQL